MMECAFLFGEHFNIDRYGRVFRLNSLVPLADGHKFSEAPSADKLALPVCEVGPKHRFFEHCQFFAKSIEKLNDWPTDEGHGTALVQVREMQYEEECLASEEKQNPRTMFMGLASLLRRRGIAAVHPPPPRPPPIRKAPDNLANQPPPPGLGSSQPAPGLSHAGAVGGHVTATGVGGGGSAAPGNGHAPGLSGLPRTGSALKADPYHAFPDVVDNFARDARRFEIPTRTRGGGVVRTSELYQVEGSLNQRTGVFEWIVDKGQITHRRFIPGGKVTGVPNQVPAR